MQPSVFADPICVEQFGELWAVLAPIEVTTEHYRVAVPTGTITDFASVPRPLWSIFPPSDPAYSAAAVCHDFLYCQHTADRDAADDFLYEAARASGTGRIRAGLIWAAVRAGGASAYATGPERQILNRRRYEALCAQSA